MKRKFLKPEKAICKAAYMMAKANVNSACTWFFYQSKLPEAVKRLRKF